MDSEVGFDDGPHCPVSPPCLTYYLLVEPEAELLEMAAIVSDVPALLLFLYCFPLALVGL